MGRYDEILARFMAFAEREPPTRRSGCRTHFKIKPVKHSKTAPMKSVTGAVLF